MQERQVVLRELAGRYRQGRKKERGLILDEVVRLCGYARPYAARRLRTYALHGEAQAVSEAGKKAHLRHEDSNFKAIIMRCLVRMLGAPIVSERRTPGLAARGVGGTLDSDTSVVSAKCPVPARAPPVSEEHE